MKTFKVRLSDGTFERRRSEHDYTHAVICILPEGETVWSFHTSKRLALKKADFNRANLPRKPHLPASARFDVRPVQVDDR